MSAALARALAGFLRRQQGIAVLGAFVYGSVARGSATETSDIDCFVVLDDEPDPGVLQCVRRQFAALQRALGYTPDFEYPIEIFTFDRCRELLRSQNVNDMVRRASECSDDSCDHDSSDAVEVLRAFTDPRVTVVESDVLATLAAEAANALVVGARSIPGHDVASVARLLGLDGEQVAKTLSAEDAGK